MVHRALSHRWRRTLAMLALALGIAGSSGSGGAAPARICPPVQNTLSFTMAYGAASIAGTAAVTGTIVTAVNPRGGVAGCFTITTAGHYGVMYVYGEDTSVSPPVPGMRSGEAVSFRVNASPATASPALVWTADREPHQADLNATGARCYDFNYSNWVDGGDLADVAGRWRNPARYDDAYDANQDSRIDLRDVMPVAAAWGHSCP